MFLSLKRIIGEYVGLESRLRFYYADMISQDSVFSVLIHYVSLDPPRPQSGSILVSMAL